MNHIVKDNELPIIQDEKSYCIESEIIYYYEKMLKYLLANIFKKL